MLNFLSIPEQSVDCDTGVVADDCEIGRANQRRLQSHRNPRPYPFDTIDNLSLYDQSRQNAIVQLDHNRIDGVIAVADAHELNTDDVIRLRLAVKRKLINMTKSTTR